MDFKYDNQQKMLRDSAKTFFRKEWSIDRLKSAWTRLLILSRRSKVRVSAIAGWRYRSVGKAMRTWWSNLADTERRHFMFQKEF